MENLSRAPNDRFERTGTKGILKYRRRRDNTLDYPMTPCPHPDPPPPAPPHHDHTTLYSDRKKPRTLRGPSPVQEGGEQKVAMHRC